MKQPFRDSVSPRFLYLYDLAEDESDPARTQNFDWLPDSPFLWGSSDEELVDLAGSGRLVEEDILVGQVDRMLNDRKLKRFCDSPDPVAATGSDHFRGSGRKEA